MEYNKRPWDVACTKDVKADITYALRAKAIDCNP